MSIAELKENYIANNPDGHFFDDDMLARYGESLERMRITGKGVMRTRGYGDVIVYEVIAEQETILGNREMRYYFDEDTFELFMPSVIHYIKGE